MPQILVMPSVMMVKTGTSKRFKNRILGGKMKLVSYIPKATHNECWENLLTAKIKVLLLDYSQTGNHLTLVKKQVKETDESD